MSGFDFSAMGALPEKKSRNNNNTRQQTLNLPIRIQSVNLVDGSGKKNVGDHIIGHLVAPAFGKNVNDLVTIFLRERGEPANKDKAPLEINDLEFGKKVKGRYRVGDFACIVAEDVKPRNDDTFECGWIKVLEYSYSETPSTKIDVRDAVVLGHVSVRPMQTPEDGNGFPYQMRFLHQTHRAQVIADNSDNPLASFREQLVSLLSPEPEFGDYAPGRAAVVLRIINAATVGSSDQSVRTTTITTPYNKPEGRFFTPEEAADQWINNANNDPEAALWLNFIQNGAAINAEGAGVLEAWPVQTYKSGKMAVDNEAAAIEAGKAKASDQFMAPAINLAGEAQHYEGGKRANQYGLITFGFHKLVMPDNHTDWSADLTYTLERYPSKLYRVEELPTDNIPDNVAAVFDQIATQRVKDKVSAKQALKRGAAPSAPEQGEPAQDFGSEAAPDPTAGTGTAFRPR